MIDQDTLNQEPYHVSGIAAHEEIKRKLTETSRQLKIIRDSNTRLVRESSELIRDAIQSKRELASTQAQLAEAVELLKYACLYVDPYFGPDITQIIEDFLAKYDKERTE